MAQNRNHILCGECIDHNNLVASASLPGLDIHKEFLFGVGGDGSNLAVVRTIPRGDISCLRR